MGINLNEKRFNLRLTEEVYEKIRELAYLRKCKDMTSFIQEAVEEKLDRMDKKVKKK